VISYSIEGGENIYQLSDYQLLKRGSVSRSYQVTASKDKVDEYFNCKGLERSDHALIYCSYLP
jgi:hypothetical protein